MGTTGRRRVGRPRTSGPEAESSPLGSRTLEERRVLILETAAGLFKAKGYAGTSVEDIARELGVTKAVVYYYWDSKEELLEEIQDRALALLRERLDRLDYEKSPYGTRLEATVAAYIDVVLENTAFVSALLRDFASSERIREKRRAFMRQCQEVVEADIVAGNACGFDPQVLTLALVGLCSQIANWYEPDGRLGHEEIKEIYLRLASRGFLLPPGEIPELDEAGPEPPLR